MFPPPNSLGGSGGSGSSGASAAWAHVETLDLTAQGDHDFTSVASKAVTGTEGGSTTFTTSSGSGGLALSSSGLTWTNSSRDVEFPISDLITGADENTEIAVVVVLGSVTLNFSSGYARFGLRNGGGTFNLFAGAGWTEFTDRYLDSAVYNEGGSARVTKQGTAVAGLTTEPTVQAVVSHPQSRRVQLLQSTTLSDVADPGDAAFERYIDASMENRGPPSNNYDTVGAAEFYASTTGITITIEKIGLYRRQLPPLDPSS